MATPLFSACRVAARRLHPLALRLPMGVPPPLLGSCAPAAELVAAWDSDRAWRQPLVSPLSPPLSPGFRWMSSSAPPPGTAEEAAVAEQPEQPPRRSWGGGKGELHASQFPPERIRNFCIVAHVDHGKSTLADRLMEASNLIERGGPHQFLDRLQVERERGITVKAQTVSMVWRHRDGHDYLVNLIDTPGHVDFSYEVSRSLAACQGALLLVDAGQGVQAQTVANFYLAFEADLEVIPAVNKIDIPAAEPERVAQEMTEAFDFEEGDFLFTSAKTGLGLETVMPAVIDRVRPPSGDPDGELRMLLFDCYYDEFRGVVVLVEVVDGAVKKGDKVRMASTGEVYDVLEIGVLAPAPVPTGQLLTGQVGYMITGMKSTRSARVGDTLNRPGATSVPVLRGFKPAKSMVFAGLYPISGDEFEPLRVAVEKLTLNDASVAVHKESSQALGAGFRCGFLGLLHMDVFHQRLEQEYGTSVIATSPTVPFRVRYGDRDGEEVELRAPVDLDTTRRIAEVHEPTVAATIVCPADYVGALMSLCQDRRGELKEHSVIGGTRTVLKYTLPMGEIATNFYDELKSVSSGYASFDYEEGGWQLADLVRLDMALNGKNVDALARIVHRSKAQRAGREMALKLKNTLPRQMFEIAVQATIGSKVVARETISAYRKNVLAKCYGGDVSRKKKLLSKQKEGKKRMRRIGSVDVPQEAFHSLLRTS